MFGVNIKGIICVKLAKTYIQFFVIKNICQTIPTTSSSVFRYPQTHYHQRGKQTKTAATGMSTLK